MIIRIGWSCNWSLRQWYHGFGSYFVRFMKTLLCLIMHNSYSIAGKRENQSSWSSATRCLSNCIIVLSVLPVAPSVAVSGDRTKYERRIPNSLCNSCQNTLVKSESWSLNIISGNPCSLYTF